MFQSTATEVNNLIYSTMKNSVIYRIVDRIGRYDIIAKIVNGKEVKRIKVFVL